MVAQAWRAASAGPVACGISLNPHEARKPACWPIAVEHSIYFAVVLAKTWRTKAEATPQQRNSGVTITRESKRTSRLSRCAICRSDLAYWPTVAMLRAAEARAGYERTATAMGREPELWCRMV